MNHITQEQAWVFACNFLPTEAAQALGPAEAQVICNAAIEWYIAQQAAREPVAYFDFQEHGFYWAPNVKIGDVPVIRKVAPMPLYSEPDMYKKDQKIDTSQERAQKGEKSIHEAALTKAVEISQEYKLP